MLLLFSTKSKVCILFCIAPWIFPAFCPRTKVLILIFWPSTIILILNFCPMTKVLILIFFCPRIKVLILIFFLYGGWIFIQCYSLPTYKIIQLYIQCSWDYNIELYFKWRVSFSNADDISFTFYCIYTLYLFFYSGAFSEISIKKTDDNVVTIYA